MSGEYDPQFQLLQIETCTPKWIIKIIIYQDRNFELTLRTLVGHVTQSLDSSQAKMFQISVGDCSQNP